MALYIDRKYLLLISGRLRNFKQKNEDLYNFSCSICGDSQKNHLRARAYIFRKNNDYFYMCHNCHISTNFSNFLKQVDPNQYKEYCYEKFEKKFVKEEIIVPKTNVAAQLLENKTKDFFVTIDSLQEDHFAKEYIRNRKIPENFWGEIYYTPHFKQSVNGAYPEQAKQDIPDDPRVVLMHTNFDGDITTVCGREIIPKLDGIRYVKVKVIDEKKAFGVHRLDKNKPVYVVEGEFDSFFLPNCVASGDSNLLGVASYLLLNGYEDIIFLYDVTPRNKEIVKQMQKTIDFGYSIVILPYDESAKDLNEMVKSGISTEDLLRLVEKYTYHGLEAKMRFIEWRKC